MLESMQRNFMGFIKITARKNNMSKITYTITIEAETEAPLDDFSVKAIGKAIIEGAEQNIDSETTLNIKEMDYAFQITGSCINEVVEAIEDTNADYETATLPVQ